MNVGKGALASLLAPDSRPVCLRPLGLKAHVYLPAGGESRKLGPSGDRSRRTASCLLAFSCRLAFQKGYEGFVSLYPKTALIDLDVAPARLSRILHDKERLNLALAYRLEHHSGALIPALLWWKLAQRAIEQEIMADTDERAQEQQRVKRVVYEEAG